MFSVRSQSSKSLQCECSDLISNRNGQDAAADLIFPLLKQKARGLETRAAAASKVAISTLNIKSVIWLLFYEVDLSIRNLPLYYCFIPH